MFQTHEGYAWTGDGNVSKTKNYKNSSNNNISNPFLPLEIQRQTQCIFFLHFPKDHFEVILWNSIRQCVKPPLE